MNGYQQLKKQLLPLLKGLPIVIVIFISSVILGKIIIRYSTRQYQTIAKIKLDDQKFGFSSNAVYSDFTMFSLEHRIEAEAELIKSPLIIEKAIHQLNLSATITRIGKLKNTVLYNNQPFRASNTLKSTENRSYHITIPSTSKLIIEYGGSEYSGSFDSKIIIKGDTLLFTRKVTSQKFELIGEYLVEFSSVSSLVQSISDKIDVKALDKETPIIRIAYKDLNTHRTADIINAICEAYIEDYVTSKSSSASETVKFIDEQLMEINQKLGDSEGQLEQFKTENHVVNTTQETETGLREISKLRVDMINLEINEKAMRDLQVYIDRGEYFNQTAINFGFGDLVLTELVKKLKFLNDERIDVTRKFTENSEEIRGIDRKIAEIKNYIKEAVNRNLKDIKIRREEIQEAYEEESHMFDKLPTREKNQHILERDFLMNERVYTFLEQKKIDASILANSLISFHRIIQPAVAPKQPVSPNKTLITFVSGLLGLILGIAFIYGKQYMSAKVISKEDIERNSQLPFAGIIRTNATTEDFDMLFQGILLKNRLNPHTIITVCSAHDLEGKSYITRGIHQSIISFGHTCCSIDFADAEAITERPDHFTLNRKDRNLHEKIEAYRNQYDFVLLKSPSSTMDVFSVQVMRMASISLFIIRANHTAINYTQEADLLVEEYGLSGVNLLMNSAHKATNYTGNYVGSRFRSSNPKTGIVQKLVYIYKTYVRS